MSRLTVGSLFSGIGGMDLGLERAGMEIKWMVEKDAYCRAVLAKHWPQVTRYEDVKDVGRSNLAPVDLICGGFPCQDISTAGKQAGIRGARSGLWSEFGRIVRELRPRYVFVENVAALVTTGLDVVVGDLAAIGYDAEWDCIPASAIGAPHQRDRLWIVAYPHANEQGLQGRISGGVQERPRQRAARAMGASLAHPPVLLCNGRDVHRTGPPQGGVTLPEPRVGGATDGPCAWWSVEPSVGRVAHGVRSRVDRLRALGNAVVPQVAEYIGRLIVQADAGREEAA